MVLAVAVSSLVLLAAAPFVPKSSAQVYSFRVDSEVVDVFVLKDGSVDIDYTINITNSISWCWVLARGFYICLFCTFRRWSILHLTAYD